MSLLFYSNNFELNSAPYMNFLKAYGDIESNELDEAGIIDEEQADIVRQYLSKMAEQLIKLQKSPSEIFESNDIGLIKYDQFNEGLNKLDMSLIDKEHINLLFEALQYDEDPGVNCIHLNELEEILHHYHAALGVFEAASESSQSSVGHVKKISMLDTEENIELSNSPPENENLSKIKSESSFIGLKPKSNSKPQSSESFSKPTITETGTIDNCDLELSDLEGKLIEPEQDSFSEESSIENYSKEKDSFEDSIQSTDRKNEEIIYKSQPINNENTIKAEEQLEHKFIDAVEGLETAKAYTQVHNVKASELNDSVKSFTDSSISDEILEIPALETKKSAEIVVTGKRVSRESNEIFDSQVKIADIEEHKVFSLHSFEPDIEPTRSNKESSSDISEKISPVLNKDSPSIFDN